jgi:serine-type D-Ala-D-Ala carboxypeptidase/endopeptidase (penicillin-binding protein 4)
MRIRMFSCSPSPPPHSSPQENRFHRSTLSGLRGAVMLIVFAAVGMLPLHARGASVHPFDGKLNEIIQRELPPNFAVSVQIADLGTGNVLAESNPDLPLMPASTMKVVTSAAALQGLKPDFTFVTEVLADHARGSSVGNLFLKGGGDPHMVGEQLFALTRELINKGLSEIRGDIVVDDSFFAPGTPLDENEKLGPRAYHAPYSALSLNFNSVKLLLHPGKRPGEPARMLMDPFSDYAVVKSHVITVEGDKAGHVTITKELSEDDREIFKIHGEIGVHAPVKGRYVNVASPALYTGEVFKQFLLREGIKFSGKVLRGQTPSSAASYLVFPSYPLGILVYWLNKHSNNFMAEQICMALGAKVYGPPGTRDKGLAAMQGYLANCGVDQKLFSLSEASGLSRNNRISASALVAVLLTASRDFTYSDEFMASLGISGVDGTLKEKFLEPALRRRLRAKTGTLRGVNSLAGYGISPEGREFAFAIIVNSLQNGTGIVDYADKIARGILAVSFDKKR